MHIFTYGSLMFPQVWQHVVRGTYRSAPASLAGHARYAIVGETYPGIIAQEGAQVAGVLYFDVAAQDVAALDAFEGEEYRRDQVPLTLASGEAMIAGTYVYLLPHRLSGLPWQPEAFRTATFLGTYCRDKLEEG